MLVPRRHVATWFEATPDEKLALISAIDRAKVEIEKTYTPDGYNVGFNAGEAAGQTIFHLHVHVIPRYDGDVYDPRGGVRHVIPGKANYLVDDSEARYSVAQENSQRLTTGVEQPLLPALRQDIDRAEQVDVAVAFTFRAGIDLLFEHFRDLLDRGGRLRFLTGDYQDCTEPNALLRLLDLADKADLRVYETAGGVGFHPKSYICHFPDGHGVAYIGSSNVTKAALLESVEWNFRVIPAVDRQGFDAAAQAFDRLFVATATRSLDNAWVDGYVRRRLPPGQNPPTGLPPDPPPVIPTPHGIQDQALEALANSRQLGNSAGLVVLATGLGKTWLSAFDSQASNAARVLFVAHREEILGQAQNTFRKIRPDAHLGRYTGTEKAQGADVLFASIQTLGRLKHLRNFRRDEFDYIVVDEFHHAAAATYRKLIDYFEPKFLLGLTATPERTDGGDLLGLCQENLVFRCDLAAGINEGLLCAFKYFGVPDDVDYQNIPWRSSRFDPGELENALATQVRAENVLNEYRERAGIRTLAFCCSRRHADFMARFFVANELRAVAVHAGRGSAPRAQSLERLEAGELDIVCAVDMFNEGVDVPNIDTVMLLRPTESSILWTQQVGRGLRKAEGKPHLTIIDYIGNHKIFLNKPKTLLGLGAGDDLALALKRIRDGTWELPAGCEVTYDLVAMEILEQLAKPVPAAQALRTYYEDFRERLGKRPTALETYHDHYSPRRTGGASWLGFVAGMGDLDPVEASVFGEYREFLDSLEKTQMTKSYKMVTLLAMLNEDAFPGEIGIEDLVRAVHRLVSRSAILQADFDDRWQDPAELRKLLEENPIAAWVGGRGTGGKSYFAYDNEIFASQMDVAGERRIALQALTRELADWRLAEYLDRNKPGGDDGGIECKVIHSSGKPIIMLASGAERDKLPHGWTSLQVNDNQLEANFVKIALNVVRRPGDDANMLPGLLRAWFGPDAGQPGTRFSVRFRKIDNDWIMEPVGLAPNSYGPQLWKRYSREQIPGLFGFEFNTGAWNSGFVRKGQHMFLLVTLEKGDLSEEFAYRDHFIDGQTFHWQSQNKTTQSSTVGQAIRNHAQQGVSVHLFVRKSKKEQGRAAPFVYCGDVGFVSWEGEQPISVTWKLKEPVPERILTIWTQ